MAKEDVLYSPEEEIFEKAKAEGKYSAMSVEVAQAINDRLAQAMIEAKRKAINTQVNSRRESAKIQLI